MTKKKMKRILQNLLLFEKFEFKTKMSKERIIKNVSSFADPQYSDHYGYVTDDGFLVGEKHVKIHNHNFSRNNFAPMARAKIEEGDDITVVSGVLRMHIILLLMIAPIYYLSLLTVVAFPIMFLFLYIVYLRPLKRLRVKIEDLLIE